MTFLGVVVTVGLLGCDTDPTVNLTGVSWYINNIDPAYYTTPSDVTCDYYLSVTWDGTAGLSDIDYARVYLPDHQRYWTFRLDADHFDATKNKLFGYFSYSADHNAVPIGDMQAEIKLKSSAVATRDCTMTAPASTSTLGYSYAYSESGTAVDSGYVAAIRRPTVTGHSIDYTLSQVTLAFTTNDVRTYDGFVWFYDAADVYVGVSSYFTNGTDGTPGLVLNGAAGLHTDGSPNALTLTSADVFLQSGYTFANISKSVLVLTDGTQYAADGRYHAHDYRSYSARITL